MGFAGNRPALPPSAIGAAQALRRNKFGDEGAIAAELLAGGHSPQDVSDATGIPIDELDMPDGMDPGIDLNGPDSFGASPEDSLGVMQDDEGNEPAFDPDIGLENQEAAHPMSVEQGIDQELDPLGAKAAAIADMVVPPARPAVSVLEGGAGKRLAEEIAKQKAAVPDAPPPEADPARVASLLTGGASGDTSFDKASPENPDPGFLDTLKGAGGKLKSILSALAPSDAAAQGLMATGFGMMGAQGTYGDTMGALGQGGLAGIKTYQQAKRREDVAQAKADQLKSLEKRADANINMKREELNAKKSTETSKQADAKEKRLAAKLTQLRLMASQGNEAEARDAFSKDPELQEYLHRKDLAFNRGSSWIKGGSGDKGPTSFQALAVETLRKLDDGKPVTEREVNNLVTQMANEQSTNAGFQNFARFVATPEGMQTFLIADKATQQQIMQGFRDEGRDSAEARAMKSVGVKREGGVGGAPPPVPVPGGAPGGGMTNKEYLERLRKGTTGGN